MPLDQNDKSAELIKAAVASLGEHFDTVQILPPDTMGRRMKVEPLVGNSGPAAFMPGGRAFASGALGRKRS